MRLGTEGSVDRGKDRGSPPAIPDVAFAQRQAEPGDLCTCGRGAVLVFLIEGQPPIGWCGLSDGGRGGRCMFCGDPTGHSEGPRCPAYQLRLSPPPPSPDDSPASTGGVN